VDEDDVDVEEEPVNELVQWIVNAIKGARCWAIVLPWEKAVRVRLGKNAVVWGPGLHLRIPWLDDVRIINNRLRIAATPFQGLSTADGKTVSVGASIGFRMADPLKALQALQQPELACAAYAMNLVARYVSERNAAQLDVKELGEYVLEGMRGFGGGGLEYDYVSIVDFAIVRTYRLLNEGWRPATNPDVEPTR
jgi:hypothetical protein